MDHLRLDAPPRKKTRMPRLLPSSRTTNCAAWTTWTRKTAGQALKEKSTTRKSWCSATMKTWRLCESHFIENPRENSNLSNLHLSRSDRKRNPTTKANDRKTASELETVRTGAVMACHAIVHLHATRKRCHRLSRVTAGSRHHPCPTDRHPTIQIWT